MSQVTYCMSIASPGNENCHSPKVRLIWVKSIQGDFFHHEPDIYLYISGSTNHFCAFFVTLFALFVL